MNILGKKVKLRAIEEGDLEKLHEWSNDPEIWDTVVGWHLPYSFESTKKWFLSLDKYPNNQKFAVENIEGELIGTASLEIDWKNNHGSCGTIIAEKNRRGKGYGSDLTLTIMKLVFEELHFEKLMSSAIEYNAAISKVAEKCGWKIEGRLKSYFYRKGRYWDSILYSVMKEDYFKFIDETNYWK